MFRSLLFAAVALLASINVNAQSSSGNPNVRDLSNLPLGECGQNQSQSRFILTQTISNGALNVRVVEANRVRCDSITFYDWSTAQRARSIDSATIRKYDLPSDSSSFTLSAQQLESLNEDCKLGVRVGDGRRVSDFYIYIPNCRPQRQGQQARPINPNGYEISRAGNCKLMARQGTGWAYTNRNLPDSQKSFCQGVEDGVVTYDWSNAGNCKVMVNGQYANRNVDARYCSTMSH